MKKKIALILVLALCASLLAGCVWENIGMKVNRNGTGKLDLEVYISKQGLATLASMGVDTSEFENLSYRPINGKSYYGISDTYYFSNPDMLGRVIDKAADREEFSGQVSADVRSYEKDGFNYMEITGHAAKYEGSITELVIPEGLIPEGTGIETALAKMAEEMYAVISVELPTSEFTVEGFMDAVTVEGNKVTVDLMKYNSDEEFKLTAKLSEVKAPTAFITKTKTYAGEFTDVPAAQWYAPYVSNCFETGLMNGTSATEFKPDSNLTIAQAITMAARVRMAYEGDADPGNSKEGKWYDNYVAYAAEKGIILKGEFAEDMENNRNATRQIMAYIFANALPLDEYRMSSDPEVSGRTFTDVTDDGFYADFIYRLVRAGIINGYPDNTYRPENDIKRSEAAKIIAIVADRTVK